MTFDDIPFVIHDCGLINFNLDDKTFYFRLCIPGYKAIKICDKITDEDGEELILDIILYDVVVNNINLPTANFFFVNCEVLDFYIDDDGTTEITLHDSCDYCTMDLKCSRNEVIQKQIVKFEQINDKDITEEDFFELVKRDN
jgi:hypothetical protein